MENYSLEVVSHLKEFAGSKLKKYHVDGIDTIGVYGDEPFELIFKNHTNSSVQIKVSIDGVDIQTGEKASTNNRGPFFQVPGKTYLTSYGSISLKAWPENKNGGAAFVFTSAGNSVALHTTGDISHKGIIAVAVYEEKHQYTYDYGSWIKNPPFDISSRFERDFIRKSFTSDYSFGTYNKCIGSNKMSYSASTADSREPLLENNSSVINSAAVGAGQYVEQKLNTVSGFKKPELCDTVRLRYLWWDDLKVKAEKINRDLPHPTGFPMDKSFGINLKNTPKLEISPNSNKYPNVFSRF
jgi:hypothetical protein